MSLKFNFLLCRRYAQAFGKKGLFYWRAMQMAWMMRLNNATRAEVDLERIKTDLGFKHPIIGVHVRHGDGCLHGRRKQHGCKPLSFYMEEVRAMRDMYGVNRVFIATDSTTALADTKKYEPEFEFIHIDMVRVVHHSTRVHSTRLFTSPLDSIERGLRLTGGIHVIKHVV